MFARATKLTVGLGLVCLTACGPSSASTPSPAGATQSVGSPPPSITPTATPTVPCRSGWTMAPDGGPSSNFEERLSAIAGTGFDDLWAVGARFPSQDSASLPLAEHWDGARWTNIDVAAPRGLKNGSLAAVASLGRGDVWAVGQFETSKRTSALIEHWDGRTWMLVVGPRFGAAHSGSALDGLAAISPSDIWALGHHGTAPGGASQAVDVFEHWDGSRWRLVPSPQLGTSSGTGAMQDLSADSKGHVWAVGGRLSGFGEVGRPAGASVERWLGGRWTPAVAPGGAIPLTMVSALDARHDWAVAGGSFTTAGTYGIGSPVLDLWDGTAWTTFRSFAASTTVTDLAVAPPDSLWVVGRRHRADLPFIDLWDGHRWRTIGNGPAARMPKPTDYETRDPMLTNMRSGTVAVLDTAGLPSAGGQQNYLWVRC
jgi:hypothetical protein